MSEAIDALKSANAHKWTCLYVTQGSGQLVGKSGGTPPTGFTVEVVDTTGAGDVFMALAFGTAKRIRHRRGCRFRQRRCRRAEINTRRWPGGYP
ncbi:hypothetical protein KCP73_11430 [Salmonella enterica subsp. enterica]|nr:hypothetical protein KCP73_11430 [Salmonella enterica subsp. enterica]